MMQLSSGNQEVPFTKTSYKEALLNVKSEASSNTSESLIELAKESLHFGELLGLRVTGDVEAAISRITTPLKKIENKTKDPRTL